MVEQLIGAYIGIINNETTTPKSAIGRKGYIIEINTGSRYQYKVKFDDEKTPHYTYKRDEFEVLIPPPIIGSMTKYCEKCENIIKNDGITKCVIGKFPKWDGCKWNTKKIS